MIGKRKGFIKTVPYLSSDMDCSPRVHLESRVDGKAMEGRMKIRRSCMVLILFFSVLLLLSTAFAFQGDNLSSSSKATSMTAVPTNPRPAKANFSIKSLYLVPGEITPGEDAKVTVVVENTGDMEGTYAVTLMVDKAALDTKEITVGPGSSRSSTFSLKKDTPGTYEVSVDDVVAKLVVVEPRAGRTNYRSPAIKDTIGIAPVVGWFPGESIGASGSMPSVFYFAPSDFSGNKLTIDLPPAKGGKTVLVAVPNLTAADWCRGNPDLNSLTVNLSVSVARGGNANFTSGRPLPSIIKPELKDWKSPIQGKAQSLPASRSFSVYDQDQKTYVSATGVKAFEGQNYAYYQDVLNPQNFSQAEYQVIDAAIEARYAQMIRLFGEPTDLDGNGHILVFISKTVASVHPHGQSYIDGCNLSPLPNSCGDSAEIVYFFSPDALKSGSRSSLAADYYPRNILHESVHILQQAHSYRKNGRSGRPSAPAYLTEGQAELINLLTNLGYADDWNRAAHELSMSDQSKANPFFYPYGLGAIFVYYLHQTFGEGISQALINAMFSGCSASGSPIETATGIPEPLVLSMMYASLYFDDTDTGKQTGLQFPFDNVPSLIKSLPVVQARIGQAVQSTRSYTGAAIHEIVADQSVRVIVDSGTTRAFVLVVQAQENSGGG